MMAAKLRCMLYPGQFSSELAVVVESAAGRTFSLFAQKAELEFRGEPTDDEPVEGWLQVDIVGRDGARFLVKLPQSTIENGQFVTVPANQLSDLPQAPRGATEQVA